MTASKGSLAEGAVSRGLTEGVTPPSRPQAARLPSRSAEGLFAAADGLYSFR